MIFLIVNEADSLALVIQNIAKIFIFEPMPNQKRHYCNGVPNSANCFGTLRKVCSIASASAIEKATNAAQEEEKVMADAKMSGGIDEGPAAA